MTNCTSCIHRPRGNGAWCYMFRTQPTGACKFFLAARPAASDANGTENAADFVPFRESDFDAIFKEPPLLDGTVNPSDDEAAACQRLATLVKAPCAGNCDPCDCKIDTEMEIVGNFRRAEGTA